jgi:ribulose-phosphate 3-epimerase
MTDIIPAILPSSLEDLEQHLLRLKGAASFIQIDLVVENVLKGEEAIPLWEEFDFECDIMLPHPEREVQTCVDVGASRIVVHANATTAQEALKALQMYRSGDYSVKVGIALQSHDTPDVLAVFVGLYDYVQVMGIDHIGKQGEPPDPHHKEVELIRALRSQFPSLCIQVDGAAAAHPHELVGAGADRLIVGAAVVNADDPKAALRALYTEANGAQ